MECALQIGMLDEKIIDEKLPADIDRNDGWRRFQIRWFDRLSWQLGDARRPDGRELDAVVKRFARCRFGVDARRRGDRRRQARSHKLAAIHGSASRAATSFLPA